MPVVRIPNTLRTLSGGRGEVSVEGERLGDVLTELEATCPGIDERIRAEDGTVHRFVNVFVGDTECRDLDGLATVVGSATVVSIVPAVAGGTV